METKRFCDMTPVEKLRSIWGGDANIARKLKIKDAQVIQYWFKVGYIPGTHGTRVMRASQGRIQAIDIWLAAEQAKTGEKV